MVHGETFLRRDASCWGDLSLFEQGCSILEERTGCPCLGVFPYAADIDLDDEDSLTIPDRRNASETKDGPRCAIIRFPRISNTTDFRLLPEARWISSPIDGRFDYVFLPGTKNTISDLEWLRERSLDQWLRAQYEGGATLIGICGGFQMLGRTIDDPFGMESSRKSITGLAFLPVKTTMSQQKTTRVVRARNLAGHSNTAYEIHLGDTIHEQGEHAPFAILEDGSREGIRADRIIGTYLHGAFEDRLVLADVGISVPSSGNSCFEALADWFAPYGTRFEELFL